MEFKGKNFFVRGYTTTEDDGESYDMLFTGININRKAKSDATWFGDYARAYAGSSLVLGLLPSEAHAAARNFSNRFRVGFIWKT